MSSKARTLTTTAITKKERPSKPHLHITNATTTIKPADSLKSKRIGETTARRSSLTSPTASSSAKEAATKSIKPTTPQKAVVVKVITAATLRSAEQKKVNATASPVSIPLKTENTAPSRKVQVKRPLEDDEDDIYAYYAKKQKRMEELKSASKAPTLSNTRKVAPVAPIAKPVPGASKTLTSASTKILEPAAKKKATVQAVQAASRLKPSLVKVSTSS